MSNYSYSVLVYNINNYEVLHEIPAEFKRDDVEYVYVTDDINAKSDTWTVVYEPNLSGGTFDKTYQIRFNPFKYCHSDICVRFDGCMDFAQDITPIVDQFKETNSDVCVSVHPARNTMYDEYSAWISIRNYPQAEAAKALIFMEKSGYDIKNYKGLYQLNFLIERNNEKTEFLNKITYDIMKYLGDENDIHRIDQTIFSYVLNVYGKALDLKIMNVSAMTVREFFNVYNHGTYEKNYYNAPHIKQYIMNKPID